LLLAYGYAGLKSVLNFILNPVVIFKWKYLEVYVSVRCICRLYGFLYSVWCDKILDFCSFLPSGWLPGVLF
jgi:hypothetical protein